MSRLITCTTGTSVGGRVDKKDKVAIEAKIDEVIKKIESLKGGAK